jgi:hypothetical protein
MIQQEGEAFLVGIRIRQDFKHRPDDEAEETRKAGVSKVKLEETEGYPAMMRNEPSKSGQTASLNEIIESGVNVRPIVRNYNRIVPRLLNKDAPVNMTHQPLLLFDWATTLA